MNGMGAVRIFFMRHKWIFAVQGMDCSRQFDILPISFWDFPGQYALTYLSTIQASLQLDSASTWSTCWAGQKYQELTSTSGVTVNQWLKENSEQIGPLISGKHNSIVHNLHWFLGFPTLTSTVFYRCFPT